MKCAQCRPLVSKYVDGEANPAERRQVEAHLATCPTCSALLAQHRMAKAHVGSLPYYQPDARLRTRFLESLDADERARPDEIAITRRAVAVAPAARRARPQAGRLFGTFASGFAMLLVAAAGVLVWQMAGNRLSLDGAVPTANAAAASATSGIVLPVPTGAVAITEGLPKPQPTQVVSVLTTYTATGAHTASPTATFWTPSEDAGTQHTVRDESYGYAFNYPANWWTSAGLPPTPGVLAHRIVRPWTVPNSGAPDYTLAVDVLDNQARLSDNEVVAHWMEPGAQVTALAGTVAGLTGLRTVSEKSGHRRQATFLFAGPLVYRLALDSSPALAANDLGVDFATPDGTAVFDAVVRSFQPAAGLPPRGGYAPLLFLRNGNLWEADSAGNSLHQLTTDGRVRSFALSNDLTHLAVLLAGSAAGQPAQTLEVRTLSGSGATVLWHTDEIQAVAWYGEHELVALAKEGGTRGMWRLAATTDGARALLANFQSLPNDGAQARSLHVAPDRLWITFLAGGRDGLDLYGVRPDGSSLRSLLPNTARRPAVTQYAWMPPDSPNEAAWILLLADKQLQRLTLPAGGALESNLIPLATLPSDEYDDLVVAPAGQAAALTHPSNAPAQVCVRPDPLAGAAYHLIMLEPGQFVPGSLTWTPNGQYLIYREAAPNGAERVLQVDTTGSSVGPPIDLPVEPAR
jgi:anti-sigma factor RsiW